MHARVREVEEIVGHKFAREDLVVAALTHPSAAEGKAVSASYERLEFLGDSILGSIVALYAFRRFPSMNEGELSMLKTSLVSGDTLSRVGDELGLSRYIMLGTSERGTGARGMHKALEDVFEALVGALYVDGGLEAASAFVARTILPLATPSLAQRQLSPKSRLQEVTQRDYREGPAYKIVGEEGPAHTPTFTAVALLGGRRVGRGKGSTKKAAEAASALDALRNLGYLAEAHMATSVELDRQDEGEELQAANVEPLDPGRDANDWNMYVASALGAKGGGDVS